jgi:hypothetical protein
MVFKLLFFIPLNLSFIIMIIKQYFIFFYYCPSLNFIFLYYLKSLSQVIPLSSIKYHQLFKHFNLI